MTTIEENAKKIETLTRVARLLGDQLRDQNKKIELLQEELSRLKTEFNSKIITTPLSISRPKEETDQITTTTLDSQEHTEEIQTIKEDKIERAPLKVKSSEKEELKKALNIIDNL